MSENIWNQLAQKYDNLWVQKYSLTPTRKKVTEIINKLKPDADFCLLDVGCATGQLIEDLIKLYPNARYCGVDKSSQMIELAKSKNLNCDFTVQCATNLDFQENSFDLITCCHSFPYYTNKSVVVNNIEKLLKDNGRAIFVQASINNAYDKIVMSVVEKTAEKADYLSKTDFKKLFEAKFEIIEEIEIKEKFFMPTLAGFVMRKK